MLRRSLRFVGVALAMLALAGCQINVVPITFDPVLSGTFTAQVTTSPGALRTNVAIAPGTTLYFRIEMPDGVRDLLYGEVVGSGLRVGWLSSASGATLAVSDAKEYFAGSLSALAIDAASVADSAIAPRSIDVPFVCVGPCAAIAPKSSGYYYLAVRNIAGGTRSFDLYAYTFSANDLADRGTASNDTMGSAIPFVAGEVVEGAVELVGDRDWFEYVGFSDRILTFTVVEGAEDLGLRLRFEGDDTGQFELDGLPGGFQTTNLYPGDRFQVYSTEGRAGPAGTAGYIIQND